MLYTLIKERYIPHKVTPRWHDHYATLEELLDAIDGIVDAAESNGNFVTFTRSGDKAPHTTDADEVVLTIFIGNEQVCPISAGGTWGAWENHRKGP